MQPSQATQTGAKHERKQPLPRKRLERRKRLGEAGKKEIHPCNYQFIYLFIHPFIHLLLMIIISF
jgi:hypothetical protein